VPVKEIVPGISMVKCGGHFDGSVVLHWKERELLFIADTILTVPVCTMLQNRDKEDEAKPSIPKKAAQLTAYLIIPSRAA
jgi:glyoxylase-like metal-dependent hydrolase (beta-lactamase superfamily II)